MNSFVTYILILVGTVLLASTSSQNIGEPIVHFSGAINGANPQTTLTKIGKTEVLYGVTRYGGNSSDGYGVIYRIDTTLNNTFTVVYRFSETTGCQPSSPLVYAGDGFLYGSTMRCSQFSYGNIFRFHIRNGSFAILYEFPDLANPCSLLLDKKSGLLYGATGAGSSTYYGSVFTLDVKDVSPSTTFKELMSFNYRTGAFPSNLILVNNSLYLNTQIFGQFGAVTVVKMDRDGRNARVIYAFGRDKAMGCCPWGQLVLVTDREQQYLYGTTMGAADCASTIYRIELTTMNEQAELIATFNQTITGSGPFDGLIQSTNSSFLYGVTSQGADNNHGAMFCLDLSAGGRLDSLFSFPADVVFGYETLGGLVELEKNLFYGAANLGGKYGFGTVYKMMLD